MRARAALAILLLAVGAPVAAQGSWTETTVREAVAACSAGSGGVEPILASAKAAGWPPFDRDTSSRGVPEFTSFRYKPDRGPGPAFVMLSTSIRDENDLGLKSHHLVCIIGAPTELRDLFVRELAALYPGFSGAAWWGLRRADGKIEHITLADLYVRIRNRTGVEPGDRILHVELPPIDPKDGTPTFAAVRHYEFLP